MRKITFLSIVCICVIYCFSCNQQTDQNAIAQSTAVTEGSELIANSDCYSCHKIAEPATGPAYIDIAKKYTASAENRDMLASRIINGGKGIWGQVPMTPHPALSKEDAGKMIDYIFTLSK